MKLTNTAERGATVYISDLNLKVGTGAAVGVALSKITTDLLHAIEQGLVSASFSDTETTDPRSYILRERVERAAAQREGEVLTNQLKKDMLNDKRARLALPSNPFIHLAVLIPLVVDSPPVMG